MIHLEAARRCLTSIEPDTTKYVITNDNNVTFVMQDGTIKDKGINGIQAVDILSFSKYLFESLNAKFPCKENEDTIYHIQCAISRQTARTKDRSRRNVEGFNKL